MICVAEREQDEFLDAPRIAVDGSGVAFDDLDERAHPLGADAFHMSAWVAARSRDYRGSLCSTAPPGTSCARSRGLPAIGEDPRRVGQQQRAGDVGAEADGGEEHHRRVRRLRPGMQEMASETTVRGSRDEPSHCAASCHTIRPGIAPRANAGVRYVYCSVLRWFRNPSEECVMLEGLFQPLHLFVVLVVVLVIFGPSRLPELGESLGRSIRAFKRGFEEPKSLASPKADQQIPDDTKA